MASGTPRLVRIISVTPKASFSRADAHGHDSAQRYRRTLVDAPPSSLGFRSSGQSRPPPKRRVQAGRSVVTPVWTHANIPVYSERVDGDQARSHFPPEVSLRMSTRKKGSTCKLVTHGSIQYAGAYRYDVLR